MNYCISLSRKTKTQHFITLDKKNVTDNKVLWKTIKPFLSDKMISKEKITLTEENETVSDDEDTAHVLNTIFSIIVGSLKIPEDVTNDTISDSSSDLIINLMVKNRKTS